MDAVIMAGGQGLRLGMGEKPCVELLGKPLISYVIDSLERSSYIERIFVAVSPSTPATEELVNEKYGDHIQAINTNGDNYVGDMVYAVESSNIREPVMIIMSDLPMVTPKLIDSIIEAYQDCDSSSMSVFVPISLCKEVGIRPDTVFNWEGNLIVPAGINILDGKFINEEQEYHNYMLDDPEIALNINTVDDMKRCEDLLMKNLFSN
ncbi:MULTISPECIES: NTP transferase domain-containing protein [Methanococcoides]|uniref:NTP transferase domain-containing protein n=1 Tax=Methanococcoides seepicolus TaxID=2828780 RepID=A0A9E4ZCD5_9EURY|nr:MULTISPECIES: NTP transferase domain-containing protein [Methanococcoides]MCM1985441.1 NTP transferase domain-containing protein [Methanococcoides seepicolus]NOQ48250.1 NTP transferase domain-containing protein [Methanococcoides sp.]